MRHLVRENASDALRVMTDGKGNFFVIRDLALLLQILEVVERPVYTTMMEPMVV